MYTTGEAETLANGSTRAVTGHGEAILASRYRTYYAYRQRAEAYFQSERHVKTVTLMPQYFTNMAEKSFAMEHLSPQAGEKTAYTNSVNTRSQFFARNICYLASTFGTHARASDCRNDDKEHSRQPQAKNKRWQFSTQMSGMSTRKINKIIVWYQKSRTSKQGAKKSTSYRSLWTYANKQHSRITRCNANGRWALTSCDNLLPGQAAETLQSCIEKYENVTGNRVKTIQTDNGGEFNSNYSTCKRVLEKKASPYKKLYRTHQNKMV